MAPHVTTAALSRHDDETTRAELVIRHADHTPGTI
jgi:hypothetical protein